MANWLRFLALIYMLICLQYRTIAHRLEHVKVLHLRVTAYQSKGTQLPNVTFTTQYPSITAGQTLVPGTKGVRIII